ncbi:MAG: hypothetical protein L3J84_08745 [Gammaproteobacteria bacterium]|nr:hypothetical protein [Gammaproteobacteria bacterium]
MKFTPITTTCLIAGAVFFPGAPAYSASCCGGGSSSSLLLPKASQAMIDTSIDIEQYDGFWNKEGDHINDPPDSDLNQYRLNLAYAHRLASRWQASVIMPYVWNDNQYSGLSTQTNGLGDTKINLWYEAFDDVTCVWKIKKMADLKPSAYFGATLTLPSGVSSFDDVDNNFDITGRGFYRLDGNMLIEKTIYPWSTALLLSYGKYFERSVNREYGKYVEPYDMNLGDRLLATLSLGYTQFLDSMDTVTYTLAFSRLQEEKAEINGRTDPTSGFEKRSFALTAAYATMARDWVFKATWAHAIDQDGWGENFPTTDVLTLGVSYVLR